MGWKAGNMPMESFDITILGEDISLVSGRLNYATLDNGRMEGLQSNFSEDSEEARIIRDNCDKVRLALIEISKVINKELYEAKNV